MKLMEWTKWEHPDNVRLQDIPNAAGVYELGCVGSNDSPLQFTPVSPPLVNISQEELTELRVNCNKLKQ